MVVEGLTNLKEGQELNVTETNADELGLSMTSSDSSASGTAAVTAQ